MRVAALWFPDWPVQALRVLDGAGGQSRSQQGTTIVAQHKVVVCDAPARRAGVRRGMRLRQAQAVLPELRVEEFNADRDGAVFAEIAAGLDAVASSIEVLRPGLVIEIGRAHV